MHFGFALELSDIDLWNTDLLDTHLDLLSPDKYADIPSKYFVYLHKIFKKSSRYVLKTSSRHVFKTSLRYVFKTSSRHVLKTSSRRLQNQQMFPGLILEFCYSFKSFSILKLAMIRLVLFETCIIKVFLLLCFSLHFMLLLSWKNFFIAEFIF